MPETSGAALKRQLFDYYSRHGRQLNSIAEAVRYVYDNELTEHHDIYELGEKLYLVLPSLRAFPKDVLLTILREQRTLYPDLTGSEFQEAIRGTTKAIQSVHNHLLTFRKSRRKFSGFKPEPEFPPFEELKLFHECKRKISYLTEAEADTQSRDDEQNAYVCDHCSAWHNGHSSKLAYISAEAMEKRYKRTWRRYHEV